MFGKLRQLKAKVIVTIMSIFMAFAASGVAQEAVYGSSEAVTGVAGAVIAAVVVVLVASALMNTTATNADLAETALTDSGDTGAASIVGQWTLGIAVMVFLAIFSMI